MSSHERDLQASRLKIWDQSYGPTYMRTCAKEGAMAIVKIFSFDVDA